MSDLGSISVLGDGIPQDGVFSESDLQQLADAIQATQLAATAPTASLLGFAAADGEAGRLTARTCVFDHCAALLFPPTLAAGMAQLERLGLDPLPLTPSTVVRRRLSERYGLTPDDCQVGITRVRVATPDAGRRATIELFLFPRDSRGFDQRIERAEAATGFERHLAFKVPNPDAARLSALIDAWRAEAGLLWEGGGHNPHEGGPEGSTVLYFVRDHAHPVLGRRFELHCAGDFGTFTDRMPAAANVVADIYDGWRQAVLGADQLV